MNFRHLNVDSNMINSAETLNRLVKEEKRLNDKYEKEKSEQLQMEKQKIELLNEQSNVIKQLQDRLNEEIINRKKSEKKNFRMNLITFITATVISVIGVVLGVFF